MNRRTLLGSLGALATGLAAGCLSSGRGPDETTPDGATDTPTETTPSPTPTSGPTDSSFTVDGVEQGTGVNEATVAFDDGVTVDGTIGGKNGCYTAALADVAYADGTLTVTVESYKPEDSEMCTQGFVDIHYTATVAFAGAGPETAVVEHRTDGKTTTVARASP